VNVGTLRHSVTLERPGAAVPDADGGFTQTWTALTPATVWAEIKPATARELERVVASAVQSTASHLVTIRYHPEVTTETRITKGRRNANGSLASGSREFHIQGVQNPDERNIALVLVCTEVVT
jgi:SPP1 family predicted phage head-tail adaptor